MTIVAIVQARMASSRLPGKSLTMLAGRPLIDHVVTRVAAARRVDRVVLATSEASSDDRLARHAREVLGMAVFRGSESDVLNRVAGAAIAFGASAAVRVTGDDPLKDPGIIDRVVAAHASDPAIAYACNNNPPSFPEGLDVEVVSTEALAAADAEANDPFEREHVTPFVRNRPERFPQTNVHAGRALSHHRWTLDTSQDVQFFEAVFDLLGGEGVPPWEDVLAILERRPDIAALNAEVVRSALYR